ncbi:MAG TPA: alanine racemase [Thermoanaerobaculia bacterium]|nr:alanine racemase [Thermoanaerobaculia bacterium]
MSAAAGARLRPGEHAWVVVDLGAVVDNFELVRRRALVGVYAVVKADAYGHGAIEVARALSGRAGLRGFVVARVDEAEALRSVGVGEEILVLSPGIAAGGAPEILARLAGLRLTPYLSSLAEVEAAAAGAGSLGSSLPIHLEVDTGMARAGLSVEELHRALELLHGQRLLRLAGLATHLAESEALDPGFTEDQLDRFRGIVDTTEQRPASALHVANSAAALDLPDSRFDAVRVGGALYGLDLARERRAADSAPGAFALRPAMTVRARVLQVRSVRAGTPVGYGRRWRAPRDTRLALTPLGYADGYPSALAGRARVLVGGRRCPVVGAVSMDLITVDVGDLPCGPGDEVVALGSQSGEQIDAGALARVGGDVAYEVTCRFSRRLRRLFATPLAPDCSL